MPFPTEPKDNTLPNVIELRGVTADELAQRWIMLAGFGRKEILVYCGCSNLGNLGLDEAMHSYLPELYAFLTATQLQAVIDVLARHAEVMGLHYAARYNSNQIAP